MPFAERVLFWNPLFLPFRNDQLQRFQNAQMLILQEWLVFCNTHFSYVLECKDMSHSRNGQWQGFQSVLKSRVLEPLISRHSRMAEKCHLQNVFSSEIPLFFAIPEWPINKGSRMPKCWYFRNDWCSVIHYCLMFWNATICAIPETGHDKGSRMC